MTDPPPAYVVTLACGCEHATTTVTQNVAVGRLVPAFTKGWEIVMTCPEHGKQRITAIHEQPA